MTIYLGSAESWIKILSQEPESEIGFEPLLFSFLAFLTDSRPDFWTLRQPAGWSVAALGLWAPLRLREADWRTERRPERARQPQLRRHNPTTHYPNKPLEGTTDPLTTIPSYEGTTRQPTPLPHKPLSPMPRRFQAAQPSAITHYKGSSHSKPCDASF